MIQEKYARFQDELDFQDEIPLYQLGEATEEVTTEDYKIIFNSVFWIISFFNCILSFCAGFVLMIVLDEVRDNR